MKNYIEILKKCPLFEKIEDDNLIKMLNCLGAKILNFDKKFTVFSEGSQAKYIGIVLTGSVQSILIDYEGNRTILSKTETSNVFDEDYACAEINSIPVINIEPISAFITMDVCFSFSLILAKNIKHIPPAQSIDQWVKPRHKISKIP